MNNPTLEDVNAVLADEDSLTEQMMPPDWVIRLVASRMHFIDLPAVAVGFFLHDIAMKMGWDVFLAQYDQDKLDTILREYGWNV